MVFCLDRVEPGMYMLNMRGKGGHAMVLLVRFKVNPTRLVLGGGLIGLVTHRLG